MKVQNKYSSSIKTKELIKQTFSTLITEKPNIKDITVTELVSRAKIARSSFYTHYDNIYDVAKEIQDETLETFAEKHKELKTIKEVNHYFDEIFELFKKDQETYKTLLQGDFAITLLERLRKQTEQTLYDYFQNKNIDHLHLKVTFFTDGCILLIIKYFNGQLTEKSDEICAYMKETFNSFFSN